MEMFVESLQNGKPSSKSNEIIILHLRLSSLFSNYYVLWISWFLIFLLCFYAAHEKQQKIVQNALFRHRIMFVEYLHRYKGNSMLFGMPLVKYALCLEYFIITCIIIESFTLQNCIKKSTRAHRIQQNECWIIMI